MEYLVGDIFLVCMVNFVVVISIIIDTFKQTEGKKRQCTIITPFFGAEGTLHANHTFHPAPTPPRASSSWRFGAELSLESCQTGL